MSMSISNTAAYVPDRGVSSVTLPSDAGLDAKATAVAGASAPVASDSPSATVTLSNQALDKFSAAVEDTGSTVGNALHAVGQAFEDGVNAVGDGIQDVEDAVVEGWHSVEDTVEDGYNEVRQEVESVAHAVGQAAIAAYDAVANATDRAVSYVTMAGQAVSDAV
jgi:phage-related protein